MDTGCFTKGLIGGRDVAITVDGRTFTVARSVLIDLMNVAGNVAADEEKALLEKPLKDVLGRGRGLLDCDLDNLRTELECYRDRQAAANAIADHLRSR